MKFILEKTIKILLSGFILNTINSCTYFNGTTIDPIYLKPDFISLILVPTKNSIDILNSENNRIIESIGTGQNPTSIAVSPSEKLVLVSNYDSGDISVFFRLYNSQGDYLKNIGSVGKGSKPVGIFFNPNPNINEAYVAYEGDGKILVLNTKALSGLPKIIKTITLNDYAPRKIVVSNDGNKIYITDNSSQKLIILNRSADYNKSEISYSSFLSKESLTEQNKINLDGIYIDNPTTIKNSKNEMLKLGTGRIFIADNTQDNVIVIKDDKVEKIISLKDSTIDNDTKIGPKNLTIYRNADKNIEKLYVTGNSASVVSIIDLKTLTLLKNIHFTHIKDDIYRYKPVGITNSVIPSKADVISVSFDSGFDVMHIDPTQDILMRGFGTTLIYQPIRPMGEMISIKK